MTNSRGKHDFHSNASHKGSSERLDRGVIPKVTSRDDQESVYGSLAELITLQKQ